MFVHKKQNWIILFFVFSFYLINFFKTSFYSNYLKFLSYLYDERERGRELQIW